MNIKQMGRGADGEDPHWAMRREELCDPDLCPDAPGEGGRCDRLDAAQAWERGLVSRRALDLMCALKLGVRISMDEIRADELAVMPIIAEERNLRERERVRPE